MELFPIEIQDGLSNLDTKVSLASKVTLDPTKDSVMRALSCSNLDRVLATNNGQIDLYYLKSILVSLGWNLNDDVFSPEEVWAAKNTPEDKPFNLLHEDRIIGHITGNYVINDKGELISSAELPTVPFDIVTSSVIYKSWKDEAFAKFIAQTIAEIENGDWFVSMECLFSKFDYAIKGPDGSEKVVARTAETAFLTKHLRSYGGQGEYGGYKVGRLLRSFVFSGHGLVKNPANPRSVILASVEPFNGIESKIEDLNLTVSQEVSMSDSNESKLAELTSEVASLKGEIEKVNKDKTAEVEALQTVVAEKEAELVTLKTDLETKTSELTEATKRIDELQVEIDNQKAEAKKNERLSKIQASGVFSSDEVEKMQAKLVSLDDETFELMLEVAKKRPGGCAEATTSEETETETEEEADLDNVKPEKQLTLSTSADESEMKRAAASLKEYIKNTVLKDKKRGGK